MKPKTLEQNIQNDYLTITEFAKRSGYSREWIYEMIERGEILTITPFRRMTLIPVSYLKKFNKAKQEPNEIDN